VPKRGDGTPATRACGVFAVRQSLEVAHVVDLPPDAPKIASFYGRSSSSSAHALSRRNYAVDRDGAAIYRTLADIPCRPGFVCTSYMRYNRSSALQVYSQCAFDLRRDSRCRRRLPTASWCRLWSRTARRMVTLGFFYVFDLVWILRRYRINIYIIKFDIILWHPVHVGFIL